MNTHYNYRGMSHPITWLLSDPYLMACYRQQIRNANRRGIRWELSFQQWLLIWCESSHLEERGTGADQYCMSRIGDKGGYSWNNVIIQTNAENNFENGMNRARKSKGKLPAPRGVIADGTYYESYRAAARAYNTNHNVVRQRVLSDSEQFKEWRAA